METSRRGGKHLGHPPPRSRRWAVRSARPLGDLDFETRSWVPHSGWPLRPRDRWSYYEMVPPRVPVGPVRLRGPPIVGRDRPPPVAQRWIAVDIYVPVGTEQRVHRQRASGAEEDPPNVTLLERATVVVLLAGASRSAVEGCRAVMTDGKEVRVQAAAVILAAGGVENARLLLSEGQTARLSATGSKESRTSFVHVGRMVAAERQRRSLWAYSALRRRGAGPASRQPRPFERRTGRLGQRRARLEWHWNELETRTVLKTQELLRAEMSRTGLGSFVPRSLDPNSMPPMHRAHHHMGPLVCTSIPAWASSTPIVEYTAPRTCTLQGAQCFPPEGT